MTFSRLFAAFIPLLLLCAVPATGTFADNDKLFDEFDEQVIREGVINQDIYLAGERVEVRARVNGDVVAGGGQVLIENQVNGDVIAAGGRVDIRAQVFDDVRAAGGEITISNRVNGDVIAAGGHIRLDKSAAVGERAWLAGGEIEVDGLVDKELRAAGGEIVLSGLINGDVTLIADSIRILPTARIAGNLIYRSAETADISDQALIAGNVTRLPMEHTEEYGVHGGTLIGLLALFVAGTVLYLIYPHFSHATLRILSERSGVSLGLGLVVLFVTPPVIMILMATVIGSVLGIVTLLLYPLTLLMGFLAGMLFFGDLLLRLVRKSHEPTRGRRVASLAASLLIVWLAGFLPLLGGLLVFAAILLGSGALILQTYKMYKAFRRVESGA